MTHDIRWWLWVGWVAALVMIWEIIKYYIKPTRLRVTVFVTGAVLVGLALSALHEWLDPVKWPNATELRLQATELVNDL